MNLDSFSNSNKTNMKYLYNTIINSQVINTIKS